MSLSSTRAPHPSPSHVAVDVMHQTARNANYQHLQEPDLLWTGAILANRAQKDRQSRPLRDRDFLLDSAINMGLYNNKAANTFHWGQRGYYPAGKLRVF